MLKAAGLTKLYTEGRNSITGCRNVSFNIKAGEIVSLLGLNGAGKSTILKIISGNILPTEGNAFIGVTSIIESPIKAKKKIGVLFENNPLYNDMKVNEFLIFSAAMHGIRKNEINGACNETIEFCKLQEVRNRRISTLSKGFKQRVGLAQALVHNPSLIILDEPASGLDMQQLEIFQQKILQLDKSKAVLISTHNLNMAHKLCSKHILINKGEVVLQGSIEEIAEKIKTADSSLSEISFDKVLETAFDLFAGVKKNEFSKNTIR